ncbi:MAG: LysR family transcriptional regulator [Verrucomicrobiaceae bacterium]|nr:LysR family transcriptional regulator [Verrucomicrobiaceae bacterium]
MDILDTRQLTAFVVLARRGSFTQAGKELHITQSAISHAIKALESNLGCQLFLRQGKSVFLTHHGRELLPLAENIMQQMAQARLALGALDRNPRGKLTIGCTPAASQFILPTVFREFKESFPLYDIKVVPGETPETARRLVAGEIDIGICLKPSDASKLECHPIFTDELEMLVSPMHPWATGKPRLKDAGKETFIVSSRNSQSFTMLNEMFLKQGARLNHIIELGSTEAMKELAKLGIGIAVSARWTAQAEIKQKQLHVVPLPRGQVKRTWVTAILKGKRLNLAERTFVGLCEETGRLMTKKD